jgi:toxin YoeB
MDRDLRISKQFIDDILSLEKEDTKLPCKVWKLIFDILNTPHTGIGQPEALKNFNGYWSRRITQKHRLIYKFENGLLNLVSSYGHYNDK